MSNPLPNQTKEAELTAARSAFPDILRSTVIEKPDDRIFLIQLEKTVLSFINSISDSLVIGPFNSYYRLLSHQVAEYYGLNHTVMRDKVKDCSSVKLLLSKPPNYVKKQKPTIESLDKDIHVQSQDSNGISNNSTMIGAATLAPPKLEPKKKFKILKRDISSADNVSNAEHVLNSSGTTTEDTTMHSELSLEELRLQKEKIYEGLKSKIFSDTSDEEGEDETREKKYTADTADILSEIDTKTSSSSASPSSDRKCDFAYSPPPQPSSSSSFSSLNTNDRGVKHSHHNTQRRWRSRPNGEYQNQNQGQGQTQTQRQYQYQYQNPPYMQHYPKYSSYQYNGYTIPNGGIMYPFDYNTFSYTRCTYPTPNEIGAQPPIMNPQAFAPITYNPDTLGQTSYTPNNGYSNGQFGSDSNGQYYPYHYYYNSSNNVNLDGNSKVTNGNEIPLGSGKRNAKTEESNDSVTDVR